MGRGFWKFDNPLLKDTDFLTVYQVIKFVMKRYSQQLQNLEDLKDEDYPQEKWNIRSVLLHELILMELRSYTMK